MCKALVFSLDTTSVPLAKGRYERFLTPYKATSQVNCILQYPNF